MKKILLLLVVVSMTVFAFVDPTTKTQIASDAYQLAATNIQMSNAYAWSFLVYPTNNTDNKAVMQVEIVGAANAVMGFIIQEKPIITNVTYLTNYPRNCFSLGVSRASNSIFVYATNGVQTWLHMTNFGRTLLKGDSVPFGDSGRFTTLPLELVNGRYYLVTITNYAATTNNPYVRLEFTR